MVAGKLNNVLAHMGRLVAVRREQDTPDQELLSRFAKERDETAFAALMERHGALVLGVCQGVLRSPQDAEGACQATFLVLARKANSVRKPGSLAVWFAQALAF
jgi:DNA-directed RNA polymerase specialized sigma24 family protein